MIRNFLMGSTVALLLASACSLPAMDIDDLPAPRQESSEEGDDASRTPRITFDDIKKGFDDGATYVAELLIKGKNAVKNKWDTIRNGKTAQSAEEALVKGYEKVAEGVQKGKETFDKAAENVVVTADQKARGFLKSIKSWWNGTGSQNFLNSLSNQELLMVGAGVVAVVVMCGVTYVLYKNGTVARVSKDAQNHPYITVLSGASAVAVVAGIYLIYNYGLPTVTAK